MMDGLINKRVLITRPEKQAENLSKLVIEKGGEAVLFPTIEIKAIDHSDLITSLFSKLDEYDFLIFISRNAVYKTFEYYLNKQSLPKNIKIFAIGTGTSHALTEFRIGNVNHAYAQADSETLLEHNDFSSQHAQNRKILIIRGVGGRELLAEVLRKRGAQVDYAEVYERCLPNYERNLIVDLWQNVRPDMVVVTSGDGLDNLLKLTPTEYQQTLFNTPLVLMSDRLLNIAKETGFVSKMEAAIDKDDQGLMLALMKLVGD